MTNTLRRTMERNLVKGIAGRLITCPACGAIMDCRETVVVSLMRHGDVSLTRGLCATCWMRNGWSVATRFSIDVIDGRTLFPARPTRSRRTRCRGCHLLYPRPAMFRHAGVRGVWCETCYMGPAFNAVKYRRAR